ncbi:MAG: uracil-DNA glycosylase [Gemmataceae bacterium]
MPPIPANPDASRLPEVWSRFLAERFGPFDDSALNAFLTDERQRGEVFPPSCDVYRAFALTAPDAVKVVILGQDPYPTPGHAHGLAFSVKPGVRLPASLRNLFRELKDDLGCEPGTQVDLTRWARQGVLLLNRVLTVRSGEAGSHRGHGWELLTERTVEALSAGPQRLVFILWGSDAQKLRSRIDETRHVVLDSVHPSPLSAYRGFFGSKPFSRANAALSGMGRGPVDWRLGVEGE